MRWPKCLPLVGDRLFHNLSNVSNVGIFVPEKKYIYPYHIRVGYDRVAVKQEGKDVMDC